MQLYSDILQTLKSIYALPSVLCNVLKVLVFLAENKQKQTNKTKQNKNKNKEKQKKQKQKQKQFFFDCQ